MKVLKNAWNSRIIQLLKTVLWDLSAQPWSQRTAVCYGLPTGIWFAGIIPYGRTVGAAPCLVPALQRHRARPRGSSSSSSPPPSCEQALHHCFGITGSTSLLITTAVKAALPSGSLRKPCLWEEEKNLTVFTSKERTTPVELQLHLLCTIYYLGWWLKNLLHCQVKD